ncbi:putative cytochrome c subunit VB [Geopyxis carbonaria]|nr:putative cytochrome c subunit VB [Geopyxis carbonaria]
MFASRSIASSLRRAAVINAPRIVAPRTFAISAFRASGSTEIKPAADGKVKTYNEIKTEADLLPPGGKRGEIPSDIEQATGLERLEILGKMEGIDIFDLKPLDASRRGTLDNPITVQSFGEEQYLGCTGCPADSHVTIWLTVSKDRPIERCPECGSVYKMDYVGPETDAHAHDHHDAHHHPPQKDVETLADYVKPQYW